ncbi:hypothetical protein ABT169_17430 [Streptomyces sp. NPDC001616]|uniref:hypothetical protein n=1 Tax=Streptomyces sp. NPDC001616 TaxID=3156648 RepID=UPI003322480F
MSTPLTTRQPLTAAAVLEATRTRLGAGWMTFPAHNGHIEGSIRSHQGHRIMLRGLISGNVFAVGLLPNGVRNENTTRPEAQTATGYGSALGDLIKNTLAPAHDAVSPTLRAHRAVTEVLPHPARTHWTHGTVTTTWAIPGGGRGVHCAEPRADFPKSTPNGPGTDSWVRLTGLTAEQATTVLRALHTRNADPRQHEPVHGGLAQQMKEAAPGLRPVNTHNWPRLGGSCTTTLSVDERVKVELHYGARPNVANIVVTGPLLANQLNAVTAL